jgi:virginiamycin B lyase
VQEYPVPAGSRAHDVALAADGCSVWYTAQGSGQLGLLDPATGESRLIPLGDGSAPHSGSSARREPAGSPTAA